MSRTLDGAIGWGVYGVTYEDAHADPEIWSHLVEEQDRVVERVKLALAANGWLLVNDGLDALIPEPHDPGAKR